VVGTIRNNTPSDYLGALRGGQYTKAGGMIAYVLTDRALGTGGSHLIFDINKLVSEYCGSSDRSDALISSRWRRCLRSPSITLSFQADLQFRNLRANEIVN
jgi:hypothetical protein